MEATHLALVRGPNADAVALARRNREIRALAEDHAVDEVARCYALAPSTVRPIIA